MELPTRIPLFPLPNVVLFPGVPLPLHIFEPRYCEMVRAARAGAQFIGMTLLKGDWREHYHGTPTIFAVGCGGRMVNLEELPDGRFNILLHGVREFVVRQELGGHDYREAEIDWRGIEAAPTLAVGRRDHVIQLLEGVLATVPDAQVRTLVRDESLSDEMLVNFFCYALDLPPLEKQGLLECATLAERVDQLCRGLEFRLEEVRLGGTGTAESDQHH